MSEAAILRTLQQGVIAAVAASTMPTLPVAYVGLNLDVPNNQKWLEVIYIPNNIQGDLWGQDKNYRGIMRLILHWPKDGTSAYAPLGLMQSIAGYFWKGRLLSGVQIYATDLTGIVEEDDDRLFPVSIRYQSYQRNG